jgi:phosphate-selective porin OprO/OprP
VAYAYLQGAHRNGGILGRVPADGGTTDFRNLAADLIFKYAGASLQAEAFWRQGFRKPGSAKDGAGAVIAAEAPRDGFGFFTQAGYLLPFTSFEVGARYGQLRPQGAGSGLRERRELGGVLSYYFAQHSLKLQADYFRLWGTEGIRAGENQVRIQVEAGF